MLDNGKKTEIALKMLNQIGYFQIIFNGNCVKNDLEITENYEVRCISEELG